MKASESVRISWRAIKGHKLRSTLTTLGVIIGVGAVIVFMVLGGGFEADLLSDIEEEEEPIISVQTQAGGGFGVQFVQSPIYTQSDVNAVSEIDGVDYVAPDGSLSAVQLRYEDQQLAGGGGFAGGFGVDTTPQERFQDDLWEMVEGDVHSSDDEAVVNEPMVELLDGFSVGDELTIRFEDGSRKTFTVTGIVDDDTGGPNPPTVHVPMENYQLTIETPRGTEERAYTGLVVGVESFEELRDVQDRIDEYFQSGSDAAELKEDDHTVEVQTVEDLVDQFTDVIDQFALFLGGIAGISLVVGSIGIANIMIVSVTERTREIGIMKAVGARNRDIIQLFLVESVILGAIGAVVGVFVGLGFGYLGVTLAGWPMAYPTDWILIAVVVGVLVGVVAGLYPAWRAAKVDPIEALRRE